MGGRLIWDDLVEQARAALGRRRSCARSAPGCGRSWTETSAQVAAAYHAAERGRGPRRRAARAALWEGAAQRRAEDPGFALEAARILDVPVDGRLPSWWSPAARDLEAVPGCDRPRWPRRCRCGRRAARRAGRPGLLVDGRTRTASWPRCATGLRGPGGVSAAGRGLAGVDAGCRQASLALRTLGAATRLAALRRAAARGAAAAVAPEVAGRLVAAWLGPLLELPEAERGPLLATLDAWVATSGSAGRTAARGALPPQHRAQPAAAARGGHRARPHRGVPPVELGLALRAARLLAPPVRACARGTTDRGASGRLGTRGPAIVGTRAW